MLIRVVVPHLSETLVYRSLESWVLGSLFWVGLGPQAGHGGSCFRDLTPCCYCYSLLPAVTRVPSKVVKNNTSKRAPKTAQNTPKGSPAGARKVSRISTKPTFSANMPCAFDTVKTILFSRFRFATPPQNLTKTVRKTNDFVGVSANTPNSHISPKSPQNRVPVDRPFRTFLVIFLYFVVSGAFLGPAAPQVSTKSARLGKIHEKHTIYRSAFPEWRSRLHNNTIRVVPGCSFGSFWDAVSSHRARICRYLPLRFCISELAPA